MPRQRPEAPHHDLTYEHFTLTPLTPHIGAEIRGIDLSGPLDDSQLKEIRRAFLDWMVLVFRDQDLDRDAHKRFARHFGTLHVHPMHGTRSADPEILPVHTSRDSPYTAGEGWHSDVTCDEIPPLGSMLYMLETPECGGGDTLFADMALAYDLLSDPVKQMLQGLTAVHDGAIPYVGGYKSTPPPGGYPRNAHPVVTRHPETGRQILYVNRGFTSHIREVSPRESRAILEMLYAHVEATPKLLCRVEWTPGTLTFWDNRCTQHHSVWDYYPHTRSAERVSILDTEPPRA